MPTVPNEHIAIIGGGFSGVMTAVNLARLSKQSLRVTLVDGRALVGRGIAYGTPHPEHLLNVAARNMSAFRDEPEHFLQWLRTRAEFEAVPEAELRERFIPRLVYGDYVRSLSQHHLQSAGGLTPVQTGFAVGEAVDIETTADGVAIHLADGNTVTAGRAVLATGNEAPAALPGTDALDGHPAWAGDPWQPWERRLPAQDGTVIILGTGLSAVDVIITLRKSGWLGGVHAVSRHGWFPHAHFRGIEYPEFPPPGVDLATLGLDRLNTLVQRHCAALHARNANPAIIVDKLRPHTQRIWQNFTREERLAFVKEHAARWNILRHRIAPELHAQVTSAQLTGQLRIHAAGIEIVEAAAERRIRVRLDNGQSFEGDLVISATGPASRLTAIRSTLLQNLLRRGLIAPDETDMGVRVDADHTVIDAHGARSERLLALGPPLRGTLWETVAVPELRVQARRVAETLLDHPPGPLAELPLMMEYMI